MKYRKGITLLELVLALAILALIIPVGTNIFIFGNKIQKVSTYEADIQTKTRLTLEHINNITRYATKVHLIPRSSFQYSENGVRDPNTSYIGITKEGHIVIDEPGESGQPRKIQYIAKKQDGIDYELEFNQAYDEDGNVLERVLEFFVIAKVDGKVVNEIVSKVEVLNSINIEQLGTPSDPAVAIAFSMADPGSQQWIEMSPDAYITLVLDASGSMAWDMDGFSNTTNQKRIEILREKALKMIDRLASMDFNIYVSLVPFGDNANNPTPFKNLHEPNEKEEVVGYIESLEADKGSTNTGDGIRRAYFQLKEKANGLISSGKDYSDFTQHMMVLVDGATNRETNTITGVGYIFWVIPYVSSETPTNTNGNTNNNISLGNRRVVSVPENNNNYIKFLGDNLIKTYKYEHEGEQKQAINTFVIGFSNRTSDHNSLNAIGNVINGKQFEHSDGAMKPYILATDADELDFAFEQFEAEVENSLWVITRPQLWP